MTEKHNEHVQKSSIITKDIPTLLETAKAAAYEAGQYLVRQLGKAKVEAQKSLRDDLLNVDLEAERIVLTRLRKETPQLGILSEEAGYEGRQDQYWVIDPLDGSANFQRGNPTFAVAIALIVEKTTLGGVIYLPTRDELFTAIKGQGAYLNGTRIAVSEIATWSEAIALFGDFMKESDPETVRAGLQDFAQIASRARRIRMMGSAANDLAYVACGRADLLIHHATHPWDIEAGKLLVLEAGGKAITVPRTNGSPLSFYSNSALFQKTKDLFVASSQE